MKNILVHGLGQDENSYNNTRSYFNKNTFLCPNLYSLIESKETSYDNLYEGFCDYCNTFSGPLNLCGLSLGGVLALNYARDYPQKVNSIILIGVPYKIPKFLFFVQSMIFKILPKKVFEGMGIKKHDFINLVNSMRKLNISGMVKDIKCKTLILCGKKDGINKKSASLLKEKIVDSQLYFIDVSAHEVNKDNPRELAIKISEFFNINLEKKKEV